MADKHERKTDELTAADGPAESRRAVLESDMIGVKSYRDEWGRRGWAVVLAVTTALLGGVIGYWIKR